MKMGIAMNNLRTLAKRIGLQGFLLAIALPLPIIIVLAAGLFARNHYFTGCLENIHDQNIYFSFIRQARDGFFFFINAPCHIPHDREYLNFTFLIIGMVSRFSGLSMEASYILSSYVFSVAVCLCLCLLFTGIFENRKVALTGLCIAWLGAGFGVFYKVFGMITGTAIDKANMTSASGDLWMPEMTVWHSAGYSPLFISSYLMLLLAYGGIWVAESREKFWPLVISSAAIFYLALSHSYDIIPAAMISFFMFALFRFEKKKLLPPPPILAGYVLFAVGLIGGTLYQYHVLKTNPGFLAWAAQNVNRSPGFHMILAGFGVLSLGYIEILLMIFVDRKKLDIPAKILGFWLVFQTILLYSPFPFSRRFILGIIIPLAVFFTFFLIRLWRRGIPSKICATILLLAVPLTFVYQTAANAGKFAARDSRYFYGKSATEAYSAMSSLKQNDVVMGSLEESNCIMRFCPAQMACASTQQSAPGMRESIENIFSGNIGAKDMDAFMKNNRITCLFLNKKAQSVFISAVPDFLLRKNLFFENDGYIIYRVGENGL